MKQFVELETNQGMAFIPLANIAYFETPKNMSGFGGGGIGKYRVKLMLLGRQEYLIQADDYNRLGTLLDEAGIPSIEIPGTTKATIVVVPNVSSFNRYSDPSTSRTLSKTAPTPLDRGIEARMIDGQTIKAEPRDPETDLYEVFKGVIANDAQV